MRLFSRAVRLMLRRRDWGTPTALAARARRLFGAPGPYRWLRTRGLRLEQVDARGVRGEWLSTKQSDDAHAGGATILYIHGGGYVSCSPATHRPITSALAKRTGARVFSTEYRLAPEHRFPAAISDVVAAYRWLIKSGVEPGRLAVAGDSAGGGLALALLLILRDAREPLPACAVLFSPWTNLTGSFASCRANDGKCWMFRPENMEQFARTYLGDVAATDPRASPAFGNLRGLPPMLLQVGSTELLLDDSREVADAVRNVGGSADLEIFPDVFHCWQMLDGLVPEAGEALGQAADFIATHTSSRES